MQFLTGLFDGQSNTIVTAFFALVFVLALIVFGMWALKFVFGTTSRITRARPRRLMVVERLQVDGRRQLLIVRRDGVEHVLMTGGGHDLVVETGIPVEERHPHHAGQSHAAVTPRTGATAAVPVETVTQTPAANVPAAAVPAATPAAIVTPAPGPRPVIPTPPPTAAPPAAPPHPTEAAPRPLPGHPDAVKEALTASFQRRGPSLRHTALLRPVSVMEPAVIPMPPLPGDKSGRPAADSDRTAQSIDHGGQDGVGRAATFGDKDNAGPS